MLDINKRFVSDTVTQNPYFSRCNTQAILVRNLQQKAQEMLRLKKSTYDVSIQIRMEIQKYNKLESKFFATHARTVSACHLQEGKAWQDK